MEYFDIFHYAVQKDQVDLRGSLEEDKLFIRFQFFSDRYYETIFSEALSSLGVPKDEHPAAVETLFRKVEAVVDPKCPVFLGVFDTTVVEGDVTLDPNLPNWIPASRSFIQGLEPVPFDNDIIARSPYCTVCLEDFEQQGPITQLPCTHHFHLHCIVQCLEVNHMCPLCRYEMPIDQD
ncbi:hypothetical protein ACLB2K_057214 [Fragaria x ananassa]